MHLASDNIFFEPDLDKPNVNLSVALDAWDDLRRNSVEAATSQSYDASIWEFAANECIYFASINRYLTRTEAPVHAKVKIHTEPSKSHPVITTWEPITGASNHVYVPGSPERKQRSDIEGFPSQSMSLWAESATRHGDVHNTSQVRAELFPSPVGVSVPTTRPSETIGVIYIAPSQFFGEVHLGVALFRGVRGMGLAGQAVNLLLEWVFDEARYHRVQVALMAGPGRDRALKLFTGLGFTHEGTRRRQVLSAPPKEYKDVTCMAILDTEWSIRHYFRHKPNNHWDELFERHQREREELLEWEAGRSKMKRSQSMETVRTKSKKAVEGSADERQIQGVDALGDTPEAQESKTFVDQKDFSDSWGYFREPWGSASPQIASAAATSSSAVRENLEINSDSESVMLDEYYPNAQDLEGSSSPPPSSVSSHSSWWEMDSQDDSSSASWDKCESSSAADE